MAEEEQVSYRLLFYMNGVKEFVKGCFSFSGSGKRRGCLASGGNDSQRNNCDHHVSRRYIRYSRNK